MPCRGTGKVLSYLGGEESTVACPWCAGSGTRQQGIDAQARWTAQDGEPAGETGGGDDGPVAA